MNGPFPHLLIVGDSIALGVTELVSYEIRGQAARNFVDQLRQRLAGWRIDVDAAIHRTSNEAVALLPSLLEQYCPDVVLFVIGGSDADINWGRFILTSGRRLRPNTAIDRFENNLRRMINETNTAGARVVLSDLPEHDLLERGRQMAAVTGRDVVAFLETGGGLAESDRHHEEYAAVIDRVAYETQTPVARWAERIATMPAGQRFGRDAVHPSEAAHAIITDVVADLLQFQTQSPAAPLTAVPS